MEQEWIIALLAAVSVAEFIALLIAWRQLRGYEDMGMFTPGKDCLLVTYYFLDPEAETDNRETNLQNAEKISDYYPIEAKEGLVSANQSYEERRKKRINPNMPPPPIGKVLIAVDVTLVHDCDSVRKQ